MAWLVPNNRRFKLSLPQYHLSCFRSSPPLVLICAQDVGKFLVFKIGVLFTTLFLFFTTTTLVSFTLRETQV